MKGLGAPSIQPSDEVFNGPNALLDIPSFKAVATNILEVEKLSLSPSNDILLNEAISPLTLPTQRSLKGIAKGVMASNGMYKNSNLSNCESKEALVLHTTASSDINPITDYPQVELDVEAVRRRNRRKLELLNAIDDGLCDHEGNNEILPEDLIEQMRGISSRPSSTGSTRPGTISGDSRLFAMQRQLTPNMKFADPRRPLSALAQAGFHASFALTPREGTGYSMHSQQIHYPSRETLLAAPVVHSRYDYSDFGL